MAETTTHSAELTRAEMAARLRSIADELDSERGTVRIPVGNKEVRVSPSDDIDSETTVTERSRRLRKNTEELALTLKWNPTGDTAESNPDTDAESGSTPESSADADTDR